MLANLDAAVTVRWVNIRRDKTRGAQEFKNAKNESSTISRNMEDFGIMLSLSFGLNLFLTFNDYNTIWALTPCCATVIAYDLETETKVCTKCRTEQFSPQTLEIKYLDSDGAVNILQKWCEPFVDQFEAILYAVIIKETLDSILESWQLIGTDKQLTNMLIRHSGRLIKAF